MGYQRPRGRRFIPACAGNARVTQCSTLRSAGSSPRVRGTLSLADAGNQRCRFIPACAGNAIARRKATRSQTVHPRVCGERVVGQ